MIALAIVLVGLALVAMLWRLERALRAQAEPSVVPMAQDHESGMNGRETGVTLPDDEEQLFRRRGPEEWDA